MGVFDFTNHLSHYADRAAKGGALRLNLRHSRLVSPFTADIQGAKVLDLASHDGRWCYAFARAGARSVTGIEARSELIKNFNDFPNDIYHSKVSLVHSDLFAELEKLVRCGANYDVIGVFGILYHIMDHHRLFLLLRQLRPKLIIVDSEFITKSAPMMRIFREDTGKILNSTAYFDGQQMALKGVLSHGAIEAIADTIGFGIEWLNWQNLPVKHRASVGDYFRTSDMRRGSCALRPKTTGPVQSAPSLTIAENAK